jgi:hypothetical protein
MKTARQREKASLLMLQGGVKEFLMILNNQ